MATEAEIVAFVAEQTLCRRERIDPEDLLGSTGTDGDDVHEILTAFAKRYRVAMDGYLWYFHHAPEGIIDFGPQMVDPAGNRLRRIPLTASMLAGFATRGLWDFDYPEHRMVSPSGRWIVLLVFFLILIAAAALLGVLTAAISSL